MKKTKKKQKLWAVSLGLCLLSCLAGCGVQDTALVLSKAEESGGSTVETGMPDKADEWQDTAYICVYVCGEVAEPGVVELPLGSRVEDALLAAGGFTEAAHREYVNLAAKVSDGQKIYFPGVAEAEEWKREAALSSADTVDINRASLEQLCTLPGIGEARGAAIIAYREEHGDFQKPEDLMKVPGIKQAAYEKLKDRIRTE
ncbi:MAG: helix-hairpin-helix domain-containing protein [Lachnospiraceae bacterium]|nr:helix-hairpin-helix domain-containing protein [Lachnospiraceae bacterium]